ncbi:MAG: polysaccharide deacetylase family protein [Acidimicrobiia bacterium]
MEPGRLIRSVGVFAAFGLAALLAACAAAPPQTGSDTTAAAGPAAATSSASTTVARAPQQAPIDSGPRDVPKVAVTFDSNMTDAMLAELDSGQVKSFSNDAVYDEIDALGLPTTIFLAGKWIERYPDQTRRLAADPLVELGSHSYAHRAYKMPCYKLGGLAASEMAADVERSEELLRRFTDDPTPYFRFPGLCWDADAMAAIAPTGVVVIGGDVASGDAFGTSVDAIVRQTLSRTRNGSIVVMHITGGNTAPLTAEALPRVVAGLRAKGFELVKLSDLLGPGG